MGMMIDCVLLSPDTMFGPITVRAPVVPLSRATARLKSSFPFVVHGIRELPLSHGACVLPRRALHAPPFVGNIL